MIDPLVPSRRRPLGDDEKERQFAEMLAMSEFMRMGRRPRDAEQVGPTKANRPAPRDIDGVEPRQSAVLQRVGQSIDKTRSNLRLLAEHPAALVLGPLSDMRAAMSPVMGERVSAARALRGKAGPGGGSLPLGETVTPENSPAAVSPEEKRQASLNTMINTASMFLPGSSLAARGGINAALGAYYDQDDPLAGAMTGLAAGEVFHHGIPSLAAQNIKGIDPAWMQRGASATAPRMEPTAQLEMVPGRLWKTRSEITKAYPGTRADYSAEAMANVAEPVLRAVETGAQLRGAQKNAPSSFFRGADASENLFSQAGSGAYEGAGNMNLQVEIPTTRADGTPLTSRDRQALAHALAFTTRQDAVPIWNPAPVKGAVAKELAKLEPQAAGQRARELNAPQTGGIGFDLERPPRPGEVDHIAQVLQQAGIPDGFTIDRNNRLLLANFSGTMSDAALHKAAVSALKNDPIFEKLAKADAVPYYFRVDSEYAGPHNAKGHYDAIRQIADEDATGVDAGANSFARGLLPVLRSDAVRGGFRGFRRLDADYQGPARLDQGIKQELERAGLTPAPGLDQPYNKRGLDRRLLMRGDLNVPIVDAAGRVTAAGIPASTNANTTGRVDQKIEAAFARTPEPLRDIDSWKQWGSELFGAVIPKPPTTVMELGDAARAIERGETPAGRAGKTFDEQVGLLGLLDDGQGGRTSQGRLADEGLDLAQEFRQLYDTGQATPEHSLALFVWGALSRRMSVAPHETAFLDLWQSGMLEPALQKAARGEFTPADAEAFKAGVNQALPSGSFARANVSNANDIGKMLEKMARPSRINPSKTNAQVWHELMGDRSLSDQDVLRAFQQNFAGEGIGIDNKVVAFNGLVAGRSGNMVMDRVQTHNLWNADRDYPSLASNFYEKSGLSGLLQGPQGYAVQRAIQNTLPRGTKPVYEVLGRQDPGLGGYHWQTWVAKSGQEVKHGSTKVIERSARGDKNPAEGVFVTEGQFDTRNYGGVNGVLNGQKVWGHTTSDGQTYLMPRAAFTDLAEQFLKLVPKGSKITDAKTVPYYQLPGYPVQQRDALIRQVGTPMPPERP